MEAADIARLAVMTGFVFCGMAVAFLVGKSIGAADQRVTDEKYIKSMETYWKAQGRLLQREADEDFESLDDRARKEKLYEAAAAVLKRIGDGECQS